MSGPNDAATNSMTAYAPRDIRFHGVRDARGWSLKLYSVHYAARPLDWESFGPGFSLAEADLPQPPAAPGRLGAGFLIGHQGKTGDYVVLGWWDNENELPLRIFVRRAGGDWRRAQGSESICVWDLEIIWHERTAWIETVLSPGGSGARETYLRRGWQTG